MTEVGWGDGPVKTPLASRPAGIVWGVDPADRLDVVTPILPKARRLPGAR
jgi:hypothetical protein